MTPLVPTEKIPDRISEVSDLFQVIDGAIVHMDEIRSDVQMQNQVLACCEIVMSLPPSLFTAREKVRVLNLVSQFFPTPLDFLRFLEAESFVDRCPVECFNMNIEQIVTGVCQKHREQFGVALIPGV